MPTLLCIKKFTYFGKKKSKFLYKIIVILSSIETLIFCLKKKKNIVFYDYYFENYLLFRMLLWRLQEVPQHLDLYRTRNAFSSQLWKCNIKLSKKQVTFLF